jgi:mono/diheme cytochrome c family protein
MKNISRLYCLVILVLCTNVHASDVPNGASLYSQNCLSCHGGGKAMGERIAPPIVAVKNHYIKEHPEKDAFVNAIVQWVQNPSKDHTLMPGAVRKFNLMPALPFSNADLAAIAAFIFEESMEKPDWYDKHYEAEHGTKKK